MKLNIEIFPLPLLKKYSESLMQCVEIEFTVSSIMPHSNIILQVKRGSYFHEFNFGLAESLSFRKEIFLPEVLSGEKAEFIFNYGSEQTAKKVIFKPVRKWTLYLVLHSHTDLGFTAPVSDVAKIHNDNTDLAVLYCKETERWPEESRFKWTCEVSWQVQNYLKDRQPEKIEKFFEQAKKGNIEIAGMYSGELTELLGHEQAARTFYYAAKLRREYGLNIETAMLCDVPGCTKGFVQVMAKSGIKNFILADNNFIAPFLTRTDLPRPFYWCGDDDTKVLSWYTDHPFYAYWEGANYGLADSYSETRKKLPYKLLQLEQSGYTYTTFQLQYAFDNFRIEFRPAAIVKEWNETWEYPKIKLATAGEFLNNMRKSQGDSIPERKGDWTCWWDGIVTGFPYEEAQSRYLHKKIPAVETISSFLKMTDPSADYPSSILEKLYDDTLAFDEHSGTGLVWEAKTPDIQEKALKEGYGFIHNSFIKTNELDCEVSSAVSRLVKTSGPSVIVFNTSQNIYNQSVTVKLKMEDSFITLLDTETKKRFAGIIKDGILTFTAHRVPALGYKVYKILNEPGFLSENENDKAVNNSDDIILENEYWKISVCSSSGCIKSLFNKTIDREIAAGNFNIPLIYETRPVVKIEMGKYTPEIYNGDEVPGEIVPLQEGQTSVELSGEKNIVISRFAGKKEWLKQTISLHDNKVLFNNNINGSLINNKEFVEKYFGSKGMLYQEFNFNMDKAKFRYEAPCAVIDPADEQFKGSCKDYYAVQGWCQLYNDEYIINFCSPDAPLIDVGGIAWQKYRKNFPEEPSKLFIRLLSLREISGEIKSPYVKEPDLNFRFALSVNKTNSEFPPSLLQAYHMRDSIINSCSAAIVNDKQEGILPGDVFSFFSGIPDGVELLTIKKAEGNEDLIVRLREVLGGNNHCELKCNLRDIKRAFRCMITEEIIEELSLLNNTVPVEFKPYSVQTIRLRFNNEN